jgi:hypothetical protein
LFGASGEGKATSEEGLGEGGSRGGEDGDEREDVAIESGKGKGGAKRPREGADRMGAGVGVGVRLTRSAAVTTTTTTTTTTSDNPPVQTQKKKPDRKRDEEEEEEEEEEEKEGNDDERSEGREAQGKAEIGRKGDKEGKRKGRGKTAADEPAASSKALAEEAGLTVSARLLSPVLTRYFWFPLIVIYFLFRKDEKNDEGQKGDRCVPHKQRRSVL